MALHFTKKLTMVLDPSSKARAFVALKNQSNKEKFDLFVAMHGNSVFQYRVSMAKKNEEEENKEADFSLKQTFGQIECHKQGVRGVTVAANDQMFATNSFDSVKVWSVDLFMYSQRNSLSILAKQSIEEANVVSMAILPGNKYIVLGTK